MKTTIEKPFITYKGSPIRLVTHFSLKTIEANVK